MAIPGHGPTDDRFGGGPRRDARVVAVVDDNRRVADLYMELLATLGHAAYPFVDGRTFLDELAGLGPDLVIVDRVMPGLDGLEVARRTRALRPDLPILMISASAAGAADGTAVIDRFLAKPCTITQFTEAVSDLLVSESRAVGASPAGASG